MIKDKAAFMEMRSQMLTAIEEHSDGMAENKFRSRMPFSELAEPCAAKLWYQFRWAAKPEIPPRIKRLFGTGHMWEARLVEIMRGIGWHIDDIDPARKGKFIEQYEVAEFGGHAKGYVDGIASHPDYTGDEKILFEGKTYHTKGFVNLLNKGVAVASPKYYGQVCVYMMLLNLPYCVFVAVNKNDDDIYVEFIDRDDSYATDLMRKAESVINSDTRPARIAESPAFYECKICDFNAVCHSGAVPEFNCRSCQNAKPTNGGKWFCQQWQAEIPYDEIPKGCPSHKPIR